MKTVLLLTSVSLLLFPLGIGAYQYHSLTPATGFGPSGSGAIVAGEPGSFITTDTSQRGVCYNPATGNLIFVDRQGGGNTAEVTGAIYVLDASTGAIISTLTTNEIQGGTVANLAVGVAEDGVIFVANMITSSNAGPVKIYRWESETTTAPPTVAFSGDPGNGLFPDLRWGDTMDVRGAGTDTQIIMGSRVSGTTTRSAVFTTSDGLTFTAHGMTAAVANPGGGIAFAEGNTFWIKRFNTTLRRMSFDLATRTNLFVRDYPELTEILRCDAMNIDLTNGLLAMIDFGGEDGQDTIYLYSIANTNDLPQFLDSYILPVNNANGTGTAGFLSFGNGRLYAHSVNNGLFAFDLSAGTLPAPAIVRQPSPVRTLEGTTARLRVVAQRGSSFQWYKDGAVIAGATNSVLTLANLPLTASGNYHVVVSNSASSVTSDLASVEVLALEDFYRLAPLWSTGPNTQPYFLCLTNDASGTPNQRSMAYNAASNHLYVVARGGNTTAIYNVHVVNAETGDALYTLNTNGMSFAGGIGLVGIDVAEDGSIYACNVDSTTSAIANWRLYRWANADPATEPQQVFVGDPLGTGTSLRWGDVIDVRGSGINTEIVIDNSQSSNPFLVLLKPTDASLTSFTSVYWFLENTAGTSIGRSLQFGSGNTIWQKRLNTSLVRSSFDTSSPIAPVMATYSFPNPTTAFGQVAVDEDRNLAGAIRYSGSGAVPDVAELYDLTDPANPVLLSSRPFPAPKNAVASVGQVILSGNRMFALGGRNGLVAFKVEIGSVVPPTLNISRSGNSINLSWEGSDFILEGTSGLSAPGWSTIPHQAGSPNTASDVISEATKFYRLRK